MDKILSPEIGRIQSDEFYLFYEMMMQALKTDDVKEGLNKSLFMLKSHLKSGNIALFRKNEEGKYVFKMSDSQMTELVYSVGCIINKTKPLTEQKKIFDLELNISERLQNMMLFHLSVSSNNGNNDECIMAILNLDKEKTLEPLFWERTKDTMQIILKRAASYERNIKAVTTDLLTGTENRNSYEMRLHELNEADENLIVGIFDIYRLKYVNDNYSHNVGDEYIKEIANILKKYWPKTKISVDDTGMEKKEETGHAVYRIGGDEFVLFTDKENLQLASIKAELACDESAMINQKIGIDIPLGLNYGVVKHNPGDSIKETIRIADDVMKDDKAKMYKLNHVEQRR